MASSSEDSLCIGMEDILNRGKLIEVVWNI